MVAQVKSSAPLGLKGVPVEIECDLNNGLPSITIVGLGAKAIDEARERVKSALLNSGLELPRKRITINLSPADLPKDGASYDLPIAISILLASQQIENDLTTTAFVGELALDGRIKSVPGIIIHAEAAKLSGCKYLFVPADNVYQASLVKGIELLPVQELKQIYRHLTGTVVLQPHRSGALKLESPSAAESDFAEISGQQVAKRALEIAAAGHHNVLMTGPPGTGKTMLAKALPTILPPLEEKDIIDLTNIYSLARNLSEDIIINRPFRSPHHTASQISIVGGGKDALPGEISLAHKGVLFMDELPEYPRSVTEVLRQPLEDKVVDIARANRRVRYPADFMFVATQNPCPCGYYGDETRACVCTAYQINQYQKRISGPLLDRIDLIIQVDRVGSGRVLSNDSRAETSAAVQQRVVRARSHQLKRNGGLANSQLPAKFLRNSLKANSETLSLLESAVDKLDLSPRAAIRTLRVARTIADLDSSAEIAPRHASEALQYRLRDMALA